MGEGVERTVGFALLDALCYSLAAALDYMGKDGQEMLIRIGREMYNYLVANGHIDVSGSPEEVDKNVKKFFIDSGFVDDVIQWMDGEVAVAEYRNWRIFGAMQYLAKKGSPLVPCPACIVSEARSKSQGIKFNWIGVEIVDVEKRIARARLIPEFEK